MTGDNIDCRPGRQAVVKARAAVLEQNVGGLVPSRPAGVCVSLGIEVIDSFSGKCRVRFEDAWCRIDTFHSSVITSSCCWSTVTNAGQTVHYN